MTYYRAGLVPLPVVGKRALVPWRRWSTHPPTQAEIEAMAERHPEADIAFTLSSRLDIETDGPEAESRLMTMGLPLPPTATFRSPSGVHRLFRVPREVCGQQILWRGGKHEEIRARAGPGFYSVSPPSARRTWVLPLDAMTNCPPALQQHLAHTSSTSTSGVRSAVSTTGVRKVTTGVRRQSEEEADSVAAALVEWAGGTWPGLGRKFRCFIPGHRDDDPSAAIYRAASGALRFHCFSEAGPPDVSLVHAFAAVVSGRSLAGVRDLGPGEVRLWAARMRHELGFERVQVHSIPITGNAPPDALTVWEGFALLRALDGKDEAPLTVGFLERWCRLPEHRARKAKRWLLEHGYLADGGLHAAGGRLFAFYMLGRIAKEERHDALVRKAIELFGSEAVEIRCLDREAVA